MAIHLGFERAGRLGLVLAGAGFIVPAVAIVVTLAWAYVEFSTVPAVGWLLYGVKPVVIAIVLHAMWGLSRRAMRTWRAAVIGATIFGLSLLGISELALLAGGALAGGLLLRPSLFTGWRRAGLLVPFLPVGLPGVAAAATSSFGLGVMFLQFLKIGAVLYGSGYVLIAFMRGDFVERFGWLTDQQLLDAIAIGQVTPGPVFTTATFVGYLLGGFAGAAVATVAIFLPSFGFVAITHPWVSRLRDSRRLAPPVGRRQCHGRRTDGVRDAAAGPHGVDRSADGHRRCGGTGDVSDDQAERRVADRRGRRHRPRLQIAGRLRSAAPRGCARVPSRQFGVVW